MSKWSKGARDYLKQKRNEKISNSLSKDNWLSRKGEAHDYLHSGEMGYTTLSKRFDNLYKKALDYYNNDAYKGFYDTYSGGMKTEGYDANAGSLYRDLEKQSKEANEGIDELLAELDQYSRYYNEDAVKYVRDLITKRQGSYNDLLKSAGEYRDQFAQWKDEDDYNADVWQGKFAEAYNAGNYDKAEALLMERGKTLQEKYGAQLINNEEYKELLKYEEAIKNAKENNEYKPFWDAVKAGDLDSAEAFLEDKASKDGERYNNNTFVKLDNAVNDIYTTISNGMQEKFGISLPGSGKSNTYTSESLEKYRGYLNDLKEEEAYKQNNSDYLALMQNEDFGANSAYKTTKNGEEKFNYFAMLTNGGKPTYSSTGYGDLIYDVINGNEDAYNLLYNKTAGQQGAEAIAFGAVPLDHLTQLEDDEKKIFNYIYATEGKDAAYEYITHLEDKYLYSRMRDDLEKKMAESAKVDPIGTSIASVVFSPLKGMSYAMQAGDYFSDGEMTKDAPYNSMLYGSNAARSTVSADIEEKWGKAGSFAYDVGMSMGDFLTATAVSGGNSAIAGLIMGSGAAADTTLAGVDRGLDSTRAFVSGTIAGLAEFLTEKMGVDNLLDKKLLSKSKLNYILKNAIAEGAEEGATDLINWAVDDLYDLISGQDMSEWKAAIAEYEKQGYSTAAAVGKALGDRAIQLGTDIAAGAASGGVMGGGGAIMQTFAEGKEGKKYKSDPAALIDEALRIDPKNELALSLQKKLADGKKISSVELGRLSTIDLENVAEALKKGDEGIKARETSARKDVKKGIENKIAGKIERNATNEKTISSLAETITKAALGEEVSNAELRRLSKNAAGIAALNKELGLQKKGEKLKVGDSVSAIREAISSKQSSKTKLSTNNILATVAALADMDESAERGLYTSYAADVRNGREVTPEAYAAAYANAMNDGKKGVDLAEVKAKYADVLSESSVTMAYRSGENAIKILSEDLQNGENNDTINQNGKEAQDDEQGVHLREGGERYDGQSIQGQVPGMEGYARPNQSRREGRTGPRDAEAVNLSYDREVSAKDFNIKGGLESGKVKIVAEGSETTLMKEAKKYADENGLNAIFFGGGNLKIKSGNKIINARAFIQGKNVYVRVDHADFTADQLMRHETGHDMIDKGEIDIKDVRKRLKEKFTPEELNAVARAYLEAYKDTGLDADEVWEEIICDSLGDMNIFEGTDKKEAAEMAADFLPDLKETALEGRKEARAPPKSEEGKASRETAKRRSKVPPMNEFATNAMQWAYSSKTDIGEQKLFYRKGNWVLLEKTYDGFVEMGTYSHSQYDLVKKEIFEYNEKLSEQQNGQRREIEVVRESVMLYETDGGYDTRNSGNVGGQQARNGSAGSLHQTESESNRGGDNQESKHNTGHFSIELDDKYLSAVERGDMETAQRMVDEAAKKAGYDSPKLYHGTSKFGFTEFKPELADDQISVFATNDERVAATYSGPTANRYISDRPTITPESLESASAEDLLALLKKHFSDDYRMVTKKERDAVLKSIREPLIKSAKSVEDYYDDNADMFDETKQKALFNISKAIREVANAKNYNDLMDKQFEYENAFWDLKWLDESVSNEIVKIIGSAESTAFGDLSKWLDTDIFHADAEYAETNHAFWMNRNEAISELYPKVFSGIYSLYAKTDNRLEIDAEGKNWSKIDGRKIGINTEIKTRDVAIYAKDKGYDSVVIKNLFDSASDSYTGMSDIYIFFRSNTIKSADPVTYDNNGKVIPISERFNSDNDDIRYSFDLEMLEDTTTEEQELSDRERLAAMLESDDMSPSQKGLLTKYKNKLSEIEANEAEITRLTEELDVLKNQGKGNTSRAVVLENKISKLEKQNAVSEGIILNLEATKPIKRLLERERKAAYQEGLLAGQMAQGKDDAPKLRRAEAKLEAQKQSAKDKLADQRQKSRDKLSEQNQTANEKISTLQKEKREAYKEGVLAGQMAQGRRDAEIIRHANERIEANARAYLESRAKSVEGRRRTKLKEDIRNVVQTLDTLLRKGNKKSNVKIGLQDAVAAALEAFDINAEKVERYNKDMARLDAKIAAATDPMEIEALKALREKKQRNSELLSDKLAVMKKAYEDIHNNEDGENYPSYYRAEAKTIMDRISDTLAKVGDTPISEMTSSQLQSVYDMYRMVLTTVRDANTAFIDGKLEDLTENAVAMENDLKKIKKLPEERLRAGDNARGFVWNELTPYYAFNRIGSKTLMRYYEELVRGQDVYARDLDEAKKFAENLRKRYKAGSWNRNKIVSFKDKDGRDFRLNLGQMMSIYAYSKREQALDHMEKGGFFFNNKETFRTKGGIVEFISSNETGYKIDAAALSRIKSALTADQIAYVDEMQAYLTKMGEKGNEVSRKMWGIDIFNEKVYFPLKSKEDFIYQANTPAETSSLKNDGMTKETKPHASNPIVLESFDEVWANHVEKMSKYHGFVIPIDNLNKIINYGSWIDGDAQSISTMLEARYSSAVNDYLTTFIKDLNGAKSQNGGAIGWISNQLTKFKKTAVAASLSVVVQQPTAILRATSEIDAKYFAHLPKKDVLYKKWDKIHKYAPIAIIKDIGGFDAGSGKQITEWLNADTRQGLNKAMNKVDDLTMIGAALGDRLGWGAIWSAVEREVQVKQKLKYGTEEFYKACGKRFTDIIVKTQVYDSTLSRSGFMRGKDGLLKMATAFMGEPTLSINMLADTFLQAKRGTIKKRQAARTVAAVYSATVAASIVKSVIYALRDDDDDEAYLEKYAQALGGTILSDINPLSMLPIFRDVLSIMEGWDVERTDMAIVQDIYNAVTALNSENKTTWRKIEDLAGAFAALAGVPAKNLLRTAREMYNAFNDIFDGIEGGDIGGAFVEGVTGKEKSKSQTLYEALIGGDAERISAIRKDYKTDKDYEAAIRKALRSYDPRIKQAAQAYIKGDIVTRDDVLYEIVEEGVFDEQTVAKAISAEVQAIKDNDKPQDVKQDDEFSLYSASDIALAFDYGSKDMALDIIAELIEIKLKKKLDEARETAEEKGKDFDEYEEREEIEYEIMSSLRSSLTKHYKPLYYAAYLGGDNKEMNRIRDILITSELYEYKTDRDVDDVLEEWIESYEEE